MQNDKKLYVTNIPLNVTQSELKNALQTLQQDIKVRLYQKLGESLGQGEITFQTAEDCVNFMQQQKIKPMTLYDQDLRFKPFMQRQNQQQNSFTTNTTSFNAECQQSKNNYINEKQYKYKLICYLNNQNQQKSEKDLLHLFRKYCPGVSNVQKRPIIIDGQDSKICNAVLIFNNENLSAYNEKNKKRLQTSYDAIQALFKGKITARLLVGVEKDRSLERLRVILRNVPNCNDDELVEWLINEVKVPIRHIKRSGGFCFATVFDEQDAVAIVRAKELDFGKRKVIPDFVLDEMRLQYGNAGQMQKTRNKLEANESEPSYSQYSYYSDSESQEESAPSSKNNKVEIEHYDPKLGVDHYVRQGIEDQEGQNSVLDSYSDDIDYSSQQTDYETEFQAPNEQNSQENEENPQKSHKKSDENTLFISGVPKQLELSVLENQRKLFEKDGIKFNSTNELIESAVRKSVCDLFRRFGRLKKISLPVDIAGSLRGICFVQFEEDKGFEAVLQYIRTLHQIAHDVFGYRTEGEKQKSELKNKNDDADAAMRLKVNLGFLNKAQAVPDADLIKKIPPEQLKGLYEQLQQIANIPRIHINLIQGSLQVFRSQLTVKSFLNKKTLNSVLSERGTSDRCLELLKFDLLIQGALSALELQKRGIDEPQQQQRMKVYKHMKTRLEDVNNRLNPLRVQLRNFPVRITEETILEHMYERLQTAGKIAWQLQKLQDDEQENKKKGKQNQKFEGFSELPEPISSAQLPQHLQQILKDKQIIELGKKIAEKQENQEQKEQNNQNAITPESLNQIRNCLHLKALRAGRTSGLQHELLRGFAQAKQQAIKDAKSKAGLPPLTGIVYADFDTEMHAKQFIQLFNGAKMFSGTNKAIIACFAMENNLRDVKRDQKVGNPRGNKFNPRRENNEDRNNDKRLQNQNDPSQPPKKLTRDKKRRLAKKMARLEH